VIAINYRNFRIILSSKLGKDVILTDTCDLKLDFKRFCQTLVCDGDFKETRSIVNMDGTISSKLKLKGRSYTLPNIIRLSKSPWHKIDTFLINILLHQKPYRNIFIRSCEYFPDCKFIIIIS
jgi:hypothetical protein